MNIGAALSEKVGPLPVWGYGLIGAAVMFFLLRKGNGSAQQGVQYVLSYVPQTGSGGSSGGSGGGGGSGGPPPATQQQLIGQLMDFLRTNVYTPQAGYSNADQELSQIQSIYQNQSVDQLQQTLSQFQSQLAANGGHWYGNPPVGSGASNPGSLSASNIPPASLNPIPVDTGAGRPA